VSYLLCVYYVFAVPWRIDLDTDLCRANEEHYKVAPWNVTDEHDAAY
jgi:hypothetical protein